MADSELQDLTAATSVDDADVLYAVTDPAGTPAARKITFENLIQSVTNLTANTAPALTDELPLIDAGGAGQKVTVANLLGGIAGDVVINENSGDYDFRVESNGNANMVYVDGTNDKVGIGNATPTRTLEVTGTIGLSDQLVQQTYVIRKFISKTGLVDNTATNVFTITTTNETGSTDGGVFVCTMSGMVAHGSANDSAETSCWGWGGRFVRAVNAAGAAGGNSAVVEIGETAVGASAAATKTITACTATVVETSEYVQTIQFQVDCGGTTVTTAEVYLMVEVVYAGFLTAPVIAAA